MCHYLSSGLLPYLLCSMNIQGGREGPMPPLKIKGLRLFWQNTASCHMWLEFRAEKGVQPLPGFQGRSWVPKESPNTSEETSTRRSDHSRKQMNEEPPSWTLHKCQLRKVRCEVCYAARAIKPRNNTTETILSWPYKQNTQTFIHQTGSKQCTKCINVALSFCETQKGLRDTAQWQSSGFAHVRPWVLSLAPHRH